MAPRKPSRDPRQTAGAFEAFSFPGLISSIFDYAPYESLLVLRAVCKNWKYRADCLIVRRIVIKTGRYMSTSWTAFTPFGRIPHPNWYNTKIADHVAQVVLVGDAFPAWLYKAPRLEAMRPSQQFIHLLPANI
ncbi:hypothetical protein CspHIS471_0700900 [Cutaneotrichosporon sp. HIS471]|nr:hypothetical protein CspHIS471_0700900 [Cutaneotrichosporon sp. HIS471]